MIVHIATYMESMGGSIDKNHYLRELPGRPGYGVLCPKPRYDKKEKQQMAKSDRATWFKQMMARAKAIYHDPVLRAQYEAEHKVALKANRKHGPQGRKGTLAVPALLWEYIRHRVAEDMKNSSTQIPD